MARGDVDYSLAKNRIFCSKPGCSSSIPNNGWSRIKAETWFFQRNNTQWCPDHIPDWVENWRKRK